MSRHLVQAVALVAALLTATAAATPLSLEQALDLALQRSESARAARAGARGAAETVRAAGEQADPMLSLGIDNLPVTGRDRWRTAAEEMTMKRIGLAQEWASADKRAARQAAAAAMADRESAIERVSAADTRLQTALAFVDAHFAGLALTLARRDESHAREALAVGQARLATASASSAELLALKASLGATEDDTAELRQQQAVALAALRRWVGVSPDALSAPAVTALPSESAFVAAHPAVVIRQREIEIARREVDLARLNRKPDWTWEVAYGQRQGRADMLSVGVSIPLTVAPGARQDRETAARLARLEQAEAELAEAQRAAQGEFAALTVEAARLGERIERFRAGVVAAAEQRTAATTAAYRSNQASLAMLFEARHAELEAQRKLLSLERDLAKTQTQLSFKPIAGVTP
jgi:cobalt-zinc-cadmium efflux system outer membrane protein